MPTELPPVVGQKTDVFGGFGAGYKPRSTPAVTPGNWWEGQPEGTTKLNEFGTELTTEPKGAGKGRYKAGDEWIVQNNPTLISEVQADMLKAGILDAKDFRPGAWDAGSAKAFTTVLALANAGGGTWQDAMSYLLTHPMLQEQKPVAPREVTATADVTGGFKGAAQSLTGALLPASEAKSFMDYYRQQEETAYDKRDWLTAAGQGGTYERPATVANAAEEYVTSHNPDEVKAYGMASRMMEFYRMLGVV